MRKLCFILVLLLSLSGCKQTEEYETVMDQTVIPNKAEKMVIMLDLPDDASLQTMESTADSNVYVCDEYTLTAYTADGGDIYKTILDATGFSPEQLDVIQTQQGDWKRYVCVWAAAGESGEQVGRCAVLDDGNYHYVLTAMSDAENAGTLAKNEWQSVFRSFRLINREDIVNSGS